MVTSEVPFLPLPGILVAGDNKSTSSHGPTGSSSPAPVPSRPSLVIINQARLKCPLKAPSIHHLITDLLTITQNSTPILVIDHQSTPQSLPNKQRPAPHQPYITACWYVLSTCRPFVSVMTITKEPHHSCHIYIAAEWVHSPHCPTIHCQYMTIAIINFL